MTNNPSKWREFFLNDRCANGYVAEEVGSPYASDDIHVVEIGALREAELELENEQSRHEFTRVMYDGLQESYDKLEAKLEAEKARAAKLLKALEAYVNKNPVETGLCRRLAKEAIAQYKVESK